MENRGEIVIYQTADGQTSIDVTLEKETVWLSQEQMADLFGKSKSTINEHIKSIYREGELSEIDTKRKFGNSEFSDKPTSYYSLDAIISVGYRVKSQRGIQFRIWANHVLKAYLTRGYAIDRKRFEEQSRQLEQLKQTVKLLENVVGNHELTSDESTGLLKVVIDYTYALDVLDQYDHQVLEIHDTTGKELYKITYEEAMWAIQGLRDKFGGSTLFGNEKDESFQGSIAAIYQTFDRHYVYPSVEEKAANLLYFVIKNHSFSDGNKRIAAFLFVWFLEKNRHRFKENGEVKLNDNGLTALALLIAQSNPDDKELMIKLIINLINSR